MAEYIDREIAKDVFCEKCLWERTNKCSECKHPFDNVPLDDVRPVVRGRWIPVTKIYTIVEGNWPNTQIKWVDATESDEVDALKCSECGEIFDFAEGRNWCPECGSDMREQDE